MNTPSPTPTEIAKPCPFCGSPAKHRNNEFGDWYECSNRIGFGEGCPARKLCMTLEEWNRRPAPETQAVAYRNPETGHVCSREKWESMGSSFRQGMCQPLYRSPVESVPAEKIRELEAEWRNENAATGIAKPIAAAIRRECADRLAAIVKEWGK